MTHTKKAPRAEGAHLTTDLPRVQRERVQDTPKRTPAQRYGTPNEWLFSREDDA